MTRPSAPSAPRRRLQRMVVFALVGAVVQGIASGNAEAHRNDESYVYLDIVEDEVSGNVQMPYPDVREVLGLDLVGSADEVRDELAANLDLLQTYAAERTTLGSGGQPWELEFDGFEVLEEGDVAEGGLGYVILPFAVDTGRGDVPQLIEVGFTPFLDEIPDRNNVGLIANYWEGGFLGGEANELVVFTSDSPAGVIDLGDPSQWRNFRASIDLGVDHIRTGPDHIFFIFVLLLPSVLVLGAGRWQPAPSFTGSLIRVLIVATMFTLAHSITFTLAGLDLLPLPPARFTESLIAVSIVVAALHNLRPVLGHREWIIAFVFGLFHGLGFAGFVEQLDISRATKLVSLLGRNAGIEVGQAVIVLVTFPALFLLSRTWLYRPIFLAATSLLAALSSIWVVERLFELDAGLDRYVEAVVAWPRALLLSLVATLAIAMFVVWERRNGRLLTTGAPAGAGAVAVAADAAEPESEASPV